jgi:hypothetical protein
LVCHDVVLTTFADMCQGRKEYDMASKVLERLGKFETMLKDAQRDMSVEDGEACQHLASEYFVLRTLLVSAPLASFVMS